LNGPWGLASWLLEPDLEHLILTDQLRNDFVAVAVHFPGSGVISAEFLEKPVPGSPFPYGFDVIPDH